MGRKNIHYLEFNVVDGMDVTSNYRSLSPAKASVAQNIEFGVLNQSSKRKGVSLLGSPGEYTILGLHEYTTAAGVAYAMCAASNGYIYKMDALDGTWDEINPDATTYTTDVSKRYNFCNYNGNVILVNGANNPLTWTGAGDVANLGGSPPSDASLVTQCWGFCWTNSVATKPSRLYYSAYYDGASWDTVSNYIPISEDDSTYIKAISTGKQVLYVWKERSFHSVQWVNYNTTSPVFRQDSLFPIGCDAQKTIQKSPFGIIWRAGDRIYLWDENLESYPAEIGHDITRDLQGCNAGVAYKSVGLWVHKYNQYWLAVAYGTSQTTNNRVYVGTFVPTTQGLQIKWAYYDIPIGDAYLFNVNTELLPYVASSAADGNTYKLFDTDADNSAAFTGLLKTKWFSPRDFGLNTDKAYLDSLKIVVTADGDWSIEVGYELGLTTSGVSEQVSQNPEGYLIGSTYIIGVSPFGGDAEERFSERRFRGVSFEYIRFTFKNENASQPFTIKGVRVGVRPRNV